MTEQEQLTQILSLLNRLDEDVRSNNQKLDTLREETNQRFDTLREETNQRFEETKGQFQKWDDRYFQLVKEQGNTARTIIVAAASVVVLSPVLGAVANVVNSYFSQPVGIVIEQPNLKV